jgi:hypothetical protein
MLELVRDHIEQIEVDLDRERKPVLMLADYDPCHASEQKNPLGHAERD